MGLLAGKQVLITGVLTESSIAFHAAKVAQQQGARVVLTGYGRLSLVRRIANRLPDPPPVIELDVTDQAMLDDLAPRLREHVDRLDGVLHSIAYAPPSCLGEDFLDTPWQDVATAVEVSAYSLKSLATACRPLMGRGGSIVGVDFDARVTWPGYNWMGVAKAALESTTRYLARELGPDGIRVNLVAAGPLRTVAARSIGGPDDLEEAWKSRAPLGWDTTDPEPVGRTICTLLSDWLPSTTGALLHADGGLHSTGR
ncbi:enoyl-ACP reductase FabI [Saccharopolyspora sp. TS4A08]|uniref:Enoyl-[acyl-carrier-protein] reductase [NADH] n=1 Tax=Saccharopolyspora ipomoeae TaxID=3042027 RepID=A0ABT6PTQ2_9PSEU|nr:enoyl-ACP reductase FabI [Saccharopolyspora sp. TS4A08]MDI2031385.1 enoyl-ACP reductase FabI [Saccharopolyspora sp. TS4A08]